jgi:hypothetical protein
VLDWLLALNHQWYAEEVAEGLHDRKGSRKAAKPQRRAIFAVLPAKGWQGEGGGAWGAILRYTDALGEDQPRA